MSESPQSAFEHVRLDAHGALRVLTLDRAPLNVLDISMMREFADALDTVADDAGAAALLVTGEGKAFCAGVDVADHTADRVEEMLGVLHGALTRVMSMEVPVVAALNGVALGGGMELALACDVVLARAGAKLGQPEIQLGVFPPFAAAALPRLVGRARALDLCLTGRTLTAEEAMELGIVQHVYDVETFAEDSREYARSLAALSGPVLKLAKKAVVDGLDASLADALLSAERSYLHDLMQLEDAHEGLAAFLEKRPPVWKGA